jgi:hypothetical protein
MKSTCFANYFAVMEVLIDSKWASHPETVVALITELRRVETAQHKAQNDPIALKAWNQLLSTLIDAVDKKIPAAFQVLKSQFLLCFFFFFFFFKILSAVIPQVNDQWISTMAERLPTKLLAAFKSSVEKGSLIECTTALVKLLGRAGGPTKKLVASFVGAIFPVLIGLVFDASLTHVTCECLLECASSVSATVAPKVASLQSVGSQLLWKHEDPSLGSRLLAASVFLERGDVAWGVSVAATLRALSVLSSRACSNDIVAPLSKGVDTLPWLVLPFENSGRGAVADFVRLSALLDGLLNVATSSSNRRRVSIPTPAAVEHFYRLLRSDPALKPTHALLAIKRQSLQSFASYCVLAGSALLLHHARVMEILLASLSWAQSNGNATLSSVLDCYTVYIQHVPVGHLEKTLFHAIANLEPDFLLSHLALLVECRPGLWASLPNARTALIEQRVAALVLKDPEAVSLATRILTASSKVGLPVLAVVINHCGVGPHLASLALRFRPPAPVWPNQQPLYDEAQLQQLQQQNQHVFAELSGLIPSLDNSSKRSEHAVEEPVVETKRARVEEGARSVVARAVAVNWDVEGTNEAKHNAVGLSSFQPPLQVHSFGQREDHDDNDDDEEIDDLPMIVDASPSNSEE